jgi:signal transduction histidine kinase
VENYAEQPFAIPALKAAGLRTAIASPIWSHGDVTGALVAGSREGRQISPQATEAFELLAAQASAALDNARMYEAERSRVLELAELDRLKGDFLTNVSHELRTPLTVIVGNAKTLSTSWTKLDEEVRLDLVHRLTANAVALDGIIETLLDVSRLDAGAMQAHSQAFELNRVLDHAVSRLAILFSRHNLVADVDPGLVILADPSLVDRVVENLLSNAAKHTPAGTKVVLTARAKGDQATIAVSDDGPGITPEDMEHLGERFFRGGDPRHRSTRGTGLGLALARDVLKLHGSDLEIESEPGHGSRFWFSLPLIAQTAGGPRPWPAAAAAARAGPR